MREIMRSRKLKIPSEKDPADVLFILCRRRKNQPQIHPEVCQKRCKHIKVCAEYGNYIQPGLFDWLNEKGKKQGKCLKKGERPDQSRPPRKKIEQIRPTTTIDAPATAKLRLKPK